MRVGRGEEGLEWRLFSESHAVRNWRNAQERPWVEDGEDNQGSREGRSPLGGCTEPPAPS